MRARHSHRSVPRGPSETGYATGSSSSLACDCRNRMEKSGPLRVGVRDKQRGDDPQFGLFKRKCYVLFRRRCCRHSSNSGKRPSTPRNLSSPIWLGVPSGGDLSDASRFCSALMLSRAWETQGLRQSASTRHRRYNVRVSFSGRSLSLGLVQRCAILVPEAAAGRFHRLRKIGRLTGHVTSGGVTTK